MTATSQSFGGRRATGLLALIAVVGAMMGFAWKSDSAKGAEFAFCSTSGSNWFWVGPGSRCVSPQKLRHRLIQVTAWPGPDGVGEICAGAKQFADGTGGNTTPFGCRHTSQTGNPWYTFSGPYGSPQPAGYATGINNTSASNILWGWGEYYP